MSEPEWKPIETLKRDGRQVQFLSPAGTFIAPASEPPSRDVERRLHLEIFKAGGGWPNVRFNPTHWAELSD